MSRHWRPLLLTGSALAAALLLGFGVHRLLQQRAAPASVLAPAEPTPRPAAVAALGRLDPSGEVHRLAAPISGIGGSPRITRLLVQEGSQVEAGQLLAEFDTGPSLRAQRAVVDSRIANLRSRLDVQSRDISRYRQLARLGAISSTDLDVRENELLALRGQLLEAEAERERIDADLVLTELRAPIAGTVLRLHARAGERPGDQGVLELGASDRMEALIEVYESDIDRVRPDQPVVLTSENGGFNGSLRGRVLRISPQVRQREVLSSDPTQDADARIVEVRVELDAEDAKRVRDLTGLRVIARLEN
ncbi:MAG: HlyD family efflux transporter periplasmic adaptor subunit [Synechococcaceae cyanobacterium]